jgi:hypothetical protein
MYDCIITQSHNHTHMDGSSLIIIILLSVVVGMVLGTIFGPTDRPHGPNAIDHCRKTYYSKKLNKYIKFGVRPLTCPKSSFSRIYEGFKNIM